MRVLNLTSLNCQSVKNKTFKVLNYFEDSGVKIACLQETWLRSGDTSVYEIFKDFGYKFLRKERSGTRGGGLAILFRADLEIKRCFARLKKTYETFEYLCCKLN